jgi:carbon storage regulator
MLVLTRKAGEQLIIGDQIRITVVSIQGNRVRLGFTAPGDVSIQRSEVAPGGRKAAAALQPAADPGPSRP